LLNAIEYISRFSEDKPIAVTPSVFAGPVARSRASIARNLRNPQFQVEWFKENFSPELWAKMSPLGREKMAEWADQNSKFLHPNSKQELELDEDLLALGVPFDEEDFFAKTIVELRGSGAAAERAQRLLQRYVPIGPNKDGAEEWAAWWKSNQPYVFASDAGDYRWYIDPLFEETRSSLQGIARSETRRFCSRRSQKVST